MCGRNTVGVCLMAALTAISIAGCAPNGDNLKMPPNVIIISLDTLRRDAVVAYNEGAFEYSQTLGGFARDSVVFENAFCPMPHTQASHMSLLTGVYPDIHQLTASRTAVLSDDLPTMTELLSEHGYGCSAVVSCDWLKGDFGFSRGFETYTRLEHGLTFADRVNQEAKEILAKAAEKDDPFFLFLHYFDAHSDWNKKKHPNTLPYYSPPEYRPFEGSDSTYCDANNACATSYLVSLMKSGSPIDGTELASIEGLYRSGVHYLDDKLREFMTILKNVDAYDDSLIVVLADHGEELFEHGRFLHEQLYNETTSVPLIIKLPKNRLSGVRVPGPVSIVDVLPTVLRSVGIPAPRHLQGVDLLSNSALEDDDGTRAIVIRSRHRDYAVVSGYFKLIRNRDGIASFYDLRLDSHEHDALDARSRPEAQALLKVLEQFERENQALLRNTIMKTESGKDLLTEEEQEGLRQLGYVD